MEASPYVGGGLLRRPLDCWLWSISIQPRPFRASAWPRIEVAERGFLAHLGASEAGTAHIVAAAAVFGRFGAALFTFTTGNVLPSPLVWRAAAIALS